MYLESSVLFVYFLCLNVALCCENLCLNNCRNKDQCPLDNKCLTSSIIYNAQVTTNSATKNYIGLTEGTFKQRFSASAYIVLVGWLFRDISRTELDCKNCTSHKVFLWGNRMDENNKYKQNYKDSLS